MEDLLYSIIPVIIIIFIWVYILYRIRKNQKNNPFIQKQDETIELLKEIREELKKLNNFNSKNL
jgi:uncharacterized protein YxeA